MWVMITSLTAAASIPSIDKPSRGSLTIVRPLRSASPWLKPTWKPAIFHMVISIPIPPWVPIWYWFYVIIKSRGKTMGDHWSPLGGQSSGKWKTTIHFLITDSQLSWQGVSCIWCMRKLKGISKNQFSSVQFFAHLIYLAHWQLDLWVR